MESAADEEGLVLVLRNQLGDTSSRGAVRLILVFAFDRRPCQL
jgi:hypothetical protein